LSGPLKTATALVGLLAGLVAGVYVLGGLVIALRMFFDAFSFNSVVTIIGQLPRELVISTAMLDVLLPAALVGLLFGLVTALVAGLWGIELPRASAKVGLGAIVVLAAITLLLVAPAIVHAFQTDGPSLTLVTSLLGVATTFLAAYVGWYGLRVLAGGGLTSGEKLATGAGIAAAVVITPAVMFASSLSFEHAQVCVTGSTTPVKGRLIGEGGGQVLIEQNFSSEAGIVSLPSSQVTKTEYGDLSSTFTCPAPAGAAVVAGAAEAALGGHGTALERKLATELRPRLRFDSAEPWRPLEVGRFLGERFPGGEAEKVCWKGPDARCLPASGLAELKRGPEAPDFIDIAGSAKNGRDFESPDPNCRSEPPVVDCNSGQAAVIYYRRTTHEGRWYWDYWWFLRYNDYVGRFNECQFYCADHEGDWEGMTVISTPSLQPQILGAIYAAHKDRVLVESPVIPFSAGHPLAYVAEGTHATYPFRCDESDCEQYGTKAGVRLPEDRHDGAKAWGGNLDADCATYRCVRPLPEIGHPSDTALPLAGAWAGWPGDWGRTCVRGCSAAESSPNSPGVQIRFECPWAPTRWALLSADGTVSDSEPAGDAIRLRAACEAQRGD
jgi:hypothetical protein